jgi:hypothetical protein
MAAMVLEQLRPKHDGGNLRENKKCSNQKLQQNFFVCLWILRRKKKRRFLHLSFSPLKIAEKTARKSFWAIKKRSSPSSF